MNSKEKMLAALSMQRPAEMPVAPCYLPLYLEPYRRRYYLEQYRRRMKSRTTYRIQHDEDVQFRANALYQSYGILQQEVDWLDTSYSATKEWAERTEIRVIDDRYYLVDLETGEKRDMEEVDEAFSAASMNYLYGLEEHGAGENIWDVASRFQSRERVDAAIPLRTAEEMIAMGAFDVAKQIGDDYGRDKFLYCIGPAPFWSTYLLAGFQGMMTMVYDNPDLLRYMMDRKIAQWEEVYKGLAWAGIHGIWIEEAFASADLISQATYDEFCLPYSKRLADYARNAGLIPIHCFVGNMIPRLDAIRECGMTAVAPEDGHKDWDNPIETVVEKLGNDMCIFGNVDPIRFGLEASEAEIEQEVKRQINAGKAARGYVVCTGSPFPLETNPRNIDAFIAAGRKWGVL